MELEVLAERRAVVFGKEFRLFQVMIGGDCLQVIQALNNSGRCNTLYGHVVEETQSLGRTLQHCQFQHVRREVNRLVHAFARRAVVSANTNVCVEDLPSYLDDIFQSDLL